VSTGGKKMSMSWIILKKCEIKDLNFYQGVCGLSRRRELALTIYGTVYSSYFLWMAQQME
jgi:hypothetical protein